MKRDFEFDASDTAAFLDHIYSVSVDPERMVDLVDSWERQLGLTGVERSSATAPDGHQTFSVRDQVVQALDKVISAHASRIAELLSGFRTAACIINASGLIVASNEAAATVLNIMPGHRLSDLEIEPDDFEALADKVALLASASACRDAILQFRQVGSSHHVLAHLRAVDAGSSGRHLVMVTSEHHWPDAVTELLRTSYGVTTREAFVLQCITRGESVADIAVATKRSEATIRSQIQALLQKSGLGSQSELIRLGTTLLHSMGGPAVNEASANGTKLPPLYTLKPLALPDGRTIFYRVAGAPLGRPFLL